MNDFMDTRSAEHTEAGPVFTMTRSWVVLSSTIKGPSLISAQALKLSGERWMLDPSQPAGLVCVGVCVWGGG